MLRRYKAELRLHFLCMRRKKEPEMHIAKAHACGKQSDGTISWLSASHIKSFLRDILWNGPDGIMLMGEASSWWWTGSVGVKIFSFFSLVVNVPCLLQQMDTSRLVVLIVVVTSPLVSAGKMTVMDLFEWLWWCGTCRSLDVHYVHLRWPFEKDNRYCIIY